MSAIAPTEAPTIQRPSTQRLAHLKQVAEDNMRKTYLGCDHPERIKSRMLRRLAQGSYAVPLVLRNGWEAWVKAVRERLINFAIVSALVLSVMLGQVCGPPAYPRLKNIVLLRTVPFLATSSLTRRARADFLAANDDLH